MKTVLYCFIDTISICFIIVLFYRLFADILNDASILVEMLAPLFKAYFTLLACLSSISKVYICMYLTVELV